MQIRATLNTQHYVYAAVFLHITYGIVGYCTSRLYIPSMNQGWGEIDATSESPSLPVLEWKQQRVHPMSNGQVHLENYMFTSKTSVLHSTPQAWRKFMESAPKIVSVDAKMLDCSEAESKYPVMVLIASSKHVIVEFPEENAYDPCLSSELRSLLEDTSITKVFFDATQTLLTSLRCRCEPNIDINPMFYSRITSEESIDLAVEYGVVGMITALKQKTFMKEHHIKTRVYLTNASNFRNDSPLILAAAADAWAIVVCYNALRRMPVLIENACVPFSATNNHLNDFLKDNM